MHRHSLFETCAYRETYKNECPEIHMLLLKQCSYKKLYKHIKNECPETCDSKSNVNALLGLNSSSRAKVGALFGCRLGVKNGTDQVSHRFLNRFVVYFLERFIDDSDI